MELFLYRPGGTIRNIFLVTQQHPYVHIRAIGIVFHKAILHTWTMETGVEPSADVLQGNGIKGIGLSKTPAPMDDAGLNDIMPLKMGRRKGPVSMFATAVT